MLMCVFEDYQKAQCGIAKQIDRKVLANKCYIHIEVYMNIRPASMCVCVCSC